MRQLPLLLFAAIVCGQTVKLPSFDEYKVGEKYKGKLAAPKLTTDFARTYRTRIRDAAKEGPNFAGEYTIAQWGCGSGCVVMALIDERSGVVHEGLPNLDVPPNLHFADGSSTDSAEALEFRPDSRLLVARGCPNEDDKACALFYYEWDGSKFRLLRKLPAKR